MTLSVANLASARGFLGVLGSFHAELVRVGYGTYQVQISLEETSHSAIEVLNTLEQVVTQRAQGQ